MTNLLTTLANFTYPEILRLLIVLIIIFAAFSGFLFSLYKFLSQFRSSKTKVPGGFEFEATAKDNENSIQAPHDFITFPESPKVVELPHSDTDGTRIVLPFTDHNFFNLLRRVIHTGVVIQTKSEIKTQVITAFLKIYASILLEKMSTWTELVKSTDGLNLSDITKVRGDMTTSYIDLAKITSVSVTLNNKSYLLKGIPSIFIERFTEHNAPAVYILMEQVADVITDVFHPSWQSKLIAILDIFESIFRSTFLSLNATIRELNGELDRFLESEIGKL
jgi:hypothetical protein